MAESSRTGATRGAAATWSTAAEASMGTLAEGTPTERLYTYWPLDGQVPSIRLFQLQKSNEAECQIIITHHELDQAPPYYAVSYMSGGVGVTKDLRVNGTRRLAIQPPLWSVLQTLTTKPLDHYYYIDQISINFENVAERNQQAALMGAIYNKAERVVLWIPSCPVLQRCGVCGTRGEIRYPHNGLPCPLMATLLGNPYWERLWVASQLLHARAISIYSGFVWLTWKDLYDFVAFRTEDHSMHPSLIRLLNEVEERTNRYRRFRDAPSPERPNIIEAFEMGSQRSCGEQKDRVFALQSLVPTRDRIAIDYARSEAEIFLDVGIRLARDGTQPARALTILSELARGMGLWEQWTATTLIDNDTVTVFANHYEIPNPPLYEQPDQWPLIRSVARFSRFI